MTDAAAYEGARLREGLLDSTNTSKAVWPIAPIARSQRGFPCPARLRQQDPSQEGQGQTHAEATRHANNAKSKVRSYVEHVFAQQKARMGLFLRTIGIAKVKTKIGIANFA